MTNPTPIDYLAAAVLYLVVDNDMSMQGQTADTLSSAVRSRYGLEVTPSVIEIVLNQLEDLDLFRRVDDAFGETYFHPVPDFRGKMAIFRFGSTDNPTATILDRYMNGPADWMNKILSSERYSHALLKQIVGEETPSVAPDAEADEAALPPDSTSWTGLPADFVLTEERRQRLIRLLDDAERDLDSVNASNSEKAMARAFIVAAKALSDAPEPPADLIWELVQRANSLAGIASLFVSIIALFAVAR